ncbi:MAG: DNA-3-methyladenine glycosylase [Acidimicrobiia bacterium]|nr:DNA-3-methyladenine glycosylase [Acidimicrobiia bacterium]
MSSLRAILEGPVLEAAPALLGRRLRSRIGGVITEVAISEVEAYDGANDPASHAFRGPTPRNLTMFGKPGGLYVYRSYGIHWCMNIVVGEEGRAAAVLLRGGVPTVGAEEMVRRRGREDHLTDGPGNLCQALGVTGEHDGEQVLGRGVISLRKGTTPAEIERTARIGISKATESQWRFVAAVAT